MDRYVDNIGGFLDEYGVYGEKGVLKESVFAVYGENISAKIGISLTDFGVSIPDNKSGNIYSLNEILALAFMQEASFAITPLTHEDHVVELITYAMKKELIYEAFSINDSVRDKIETVFTKCVNDVIDKWNDNYYEMMRKGYYLSQELVPFNEEDRKRIWQIVNSVLDDIRSGMSAMEALKETGYFSSFVKETPPPYNCGVPIYINLDTRSLAGLYNKFLNHIGLIGQFSIKGIDKTA